MIVDTSAIVAILKDEADAAIYAAAIASRRGRMSAATYLECGIVHDASSDPSGRPELDNLLRRAGIAVLPVTEKQAKIARQAYRDFGKGNGHPAKLNFGDCFSYALAVEVDEPLLWKGDDFTHTGIESALDSQGS